MPNRGVFLDRDGTINDEVRYLGHESQLRLIDGAPDAIKLLKNSGFKVIVITNQSGVARGYFSEKRVEHIHRALEEKLRSYNANYDAVYYCPHHPTEGIGPYKIACDCRKPNPGMLKRAEQELDLTLCRSYVIGDKISDLEAGYAVGCQGVLVQTGYGLDVEADLGSYSRRPDHIAANVLEAARWIVSQEIGGIDHGTST